MADDVTYKVKRGDTLPKIAKEFGVGKWQAIWEAKENKALVAKRKNPENIQPGDELQIADVKKLGGSDKEKIDNLINFLKSQIDSLTQQVGCLNENVELLQKNNEIATKSMEDAVKQIKSQAKLMDDLADLATTAVKVVGKSLKVMEDVGEVGAKAAKAGKKTLKSLLDSVENGLKKEVSEESKDKLADKAKTLVKDQKDSTDAAIAALGTAVDYSEKLTKPSYIVGVFVQLQKGKKLNEAMATDLIEEIEKSAKETESAGDKAVAQLVARRDELKAKVEEAKKVLNLLK